MRGVLLKISSLTQKHTSLNTGFLPQQLSLGLMYQNTKPNGQTINQSIIFTTAFNAVIFFIRTRRYCIRYFKR